MTTFLVVALLWQPTIINYSFSLFNCIDYEDGVSYLRKNTSIRCWKGINYIMQLSIGLSLIGIWGFIFSIAIFLKIRENSGRPGDQQILKLYGIFYIGLNDDSFCWEIIVQAPLDDPLPARERSDARPHPVWTRSQLQLHPLARGVFQLKGDGSDTDQAWGRPRGPLHGRLDPSAHCDIQKQACDRQDALGGWGKT
jgi:hypothetical protein